MKQLGLGLIGALSMGFAGCADISLETTDESTLKVGETRDLQLRYLRFDVTNFEQRITREDILAYPESVRERLWLLDLELAGGPASPQLLDNALASVRELDPETLRQAERNMQALLQMTPDDANLSGTALEELISLAPLLGLAPERIMADLFDIDVEDTFLSDAVVADALLTYVIETHPNQRRRLGPRTVENPEGVYPVAPGSLAVTLGDVVSNFESFAERFGPYDQDGEQHPGFIAGDIRASVIEDEFAMNVRVNANALPYKGLDLTNTHVASISSLRSQIDDLFDFDDPDWLRIEGLVEGEPVIEELTFLVVEDDAFIPGGRSPFPTGIGASPAWQLPSYTLEHVLVEMGQAAYNGLDSQVAYSSPDQDEPIFQAEVIDGFQTFDVRANLGSPPAPSYVWDVLLGVAQVRLHDGGLKEGEADVALTLKDVPLGTDIQTLEAQLRENLRAEPELLSGVATQVLDNTEGAADFYYYRANPNNPGDTDGDWLFFVNDADIPLDAEGELVRPYDYAHPGFYADAKLNEKVSDTRALDGDDSHEKVRLEEGDTLFIEDDAGSVFSLTVGEKPSPNRIALRVERVR